MDEIHWPGPGSGIIDLGWFSVCYNQWRFNDGQMQFRRTYDNDGWRDHDGLANYGKLEYSEWTAFMDEAAARLGFRKPARPRQELVAEMRAKILAVSQCSTLEQIKEVLV